MPRASSCTAHTSPDIDPLPDVFLISPKHPNTLGLAVRADLVRDQLAERRRDACGLCAPTRETGTTRDYARTLGALARHADVPGDLETEERLAWIIDWFAEAHERWRASVIRHHRAALLWAVEGLFEAGVADAASVGRLLGALQRRPSPRPSQAAPRTSARKRKAITREECTKLIAVLMRRHGETAWLLCGLLGYGIHLGLRPAEFRHARVRGDKVLVQCGKATNGRALGPERSIELVGFDRTLRRGLARFLVRFQAVAAKAPSWTAFSERLSKALTRACQASGVAPVSLYTLRHQGIANAKVFLNRRAVAGLAGHASQRTVSRNYAPRSKGWSEPLRCRPTEETIRAVRELPRWRPNITPAPAEVESGVASGNCAGPDDPTSDGPTSM